MKENNWGYQSNNQNNAQNSDYQNVNQIENMKSVGEVKSNVSNILVLIIFLLLISIGYIVYDKILKKEEIKIDNAIDNSNIVSNELKEFNLNQITERDVNENELNYYKILNYKNANVDVDFKIRIKNRTIDSVIISDIFINGVKYKEIEQVYICNPKECVGCIENIEEAKTVAINNIKNSIGTIKGDKNYVYYIPFKNGDIAQNLDAFIIINEKGEILDTSDINIPSREYTTFNLSENCQIKKFINGVSDNGELLYKDNIFIQKDRIYYLNLTEEISQDKKYNTVAEEHKITINNDKVIDEKINKCNVTQLIEN